MDRKIVFLLVAVLSIITLVIIAIILTVVSISMGGDSDGTLLVMWGLICIIVAVGVLGLYWGMKIFCSGQECVA